MQSTLFILVYNMSSFWNIWILTPTTPYSPKFRIHFMVRGSRGSWKDIIKNCKQVSPENGKTRYFRTIYYAFVNIIQWGPFFAPKSVENRGKRALEKNGPLLHKNGSRKDFSYNWKGFAYYKHRKLESTNKNELIFLSFAEKFPNKKEIIRNFCHFLFWNS